MKLLASVPRRLAWAVVVAVVALVAGGLGVPAAQAATEMVIYDWNRPVARTERGFPRDFPPKQNGNWRTPVNYAEGTYYLRVEIRRQPVPQDMRLQFCVWQEGSTPMHEMCSPLANVRGTPGTVVTWSVPVLETKLRNKKAIDWTRPRRTNGVAIKDERGYPISDYGNPSWNWFGENPNAWYPLDMRFTVVVVAKGARFSGWDRYIPPAPTPFRLEAETAVLSDAAVATEHAGYTGSGFVDFRNMVGGYIEWSIGAEAAGNATLTFRYANGSAATRPVEIIVNGTVAVANLDFPATGAWTTWQTRSITVPLGVGSNTVRVRATGSSGGPNMDRLDYSVTP